MLGNATFACGIRSARERSFEEARHATPTAVASAADTPPARQPNPNLNQRPADVILPETGQLLLFCSLQLWQQCQQLQRCHQTRARMQVFGHIFLPFYGNSVPGTTRFLGKQMATSDRSR